MPTPTQRFTNKVDNYIKYRPSYPAEVIDYLTTAAKLSNASVIADIGSGTGIFTRLLLDKGYTVYAVEPNEAMRKSALEQLSGYPDFHSVNGTAELTTLKAHSIDLAVCAQAFHWFDAQKTKIEFERILKPGKPAALIWNNRQTEADEFAIAYELLLQEQGTDYKETNHRNITAVDFNNFFNDGQYQLVKYNNLQVFDEDGLIGRSFSSSFIPPKYTEAGTIFLKALEKLFTQYQVNNKVSFQYKTEIYLGQV